MEAVNHFHPVRRCELNHRRSKATSVLLIVLMAGYCLCQFITLQISGQTKSLCPGVSLRYETALNKEQVDASLTYTQSNQNSEGVYPTFWREDELTLQASSSQRIEDGVLAMGFHGNASAVYGATYLSGTSPGSGSTNECSVSDALAWALWGSQDVIGQTLTFETADKQSCTYVVCGIFSSNEEILLYSLSSENSFPYVELTGISQDNPVQSVRQFLTGAALAEPSQILYDQALAWSATILAYLPGLLIVLIFVLWILFGISWKKQFRELLFFVTALTVVILLPLWLSNLPGWLVPNQWGNAESWAELLSAGRDRLYEWVTLIPTARDSQIKILLLQEAIALFGSILLELISVSFSLMHFILRKRSSDNVNILRA